MKKLLLVAMVTTLFVSVGKAQIGWTLEECRHFLGKATELPWTSGQTGKAYSFDFGGLEVVTCFMPDADSVGSISYSKEGSKKGKRLTSKEASALLRLNGDGIEWREDNNSHYQRWLGYDKDGREVLSAVYFEEGQAAGHWPSLMIATPEYEKASERAASKLSEGS